MTTKARFKPTIEITHHCVCGAVLEMNCKMSLNVETNSVAGTSFRPFLDRGADWTKRICQCGREYVGYFYIQVEEVIKKPRAVISWGDVHSGEDMA